MADVKDILAKYFNEEFTLDGGTSPKTTLKRSDLEAELNQHYYQKCLEVIGSDSGTETPYGTRDVADIWKNELRATLRQQAKKLLGKESDE